MDIITHCSSKYRESNLDIFQSRYVAQNLQKVKNNTHKFLNDDDCKAFGDLLPLSGQKELYGNCCQQLATMGITDFPSESTPKSTTIIDSIAYPSRTISKESLATFWRCQPSSKDIVVASFPNSGSSWMIQLIHEVMTRGKGIPSGQNIDDIYKWLECKQGNLFGHIYNKTEKDFRIIKTHVSVRHSMYSGDAKYIVVIRDPEDCLINSCKHLSAITGKSFQDVLQDRKNTFCNTTGLYGGWTQHIASWWELRHQRNVLIVTYEQMKEDISGIVEKVATFLEVPSLNSDEKRDIIAHCSSKYRESNLDVFQSRYVTQNLQKVRNNTYKFLNDDDCKAVGDLLPSTGQ